MAPLAGVADPIRQVPRYQVPSRPRSAVSHSNRLTRGGAGLPDRRAVGQVVPPYRQDTSTGEQDATGDLVDDAVGRGVVLFGERDGAGLFVDHPGDLVVDVH